MDTIIYLSYGCKSVQNAPVESRHILREHIIQDYRLIKIQVWEVIPGLDVSGKSRAKSSVRKVNFSLVDLGKRLKMRRHRRLLDGARQRMSETLKQELAPLLQDNSDNRICYDSSVSQDSFVREILPFSEFVEDMEMKWVERLLPEATCHHFVVLGDAPCLRQILWELAPRMKSLLWIAPDLEAEDALEDFAEEFYQETGLAIRLQFLPAGTTYGQLNIPESAVREPVNVLDFTNDKHIPRFYPPGGSVWLDMADREEKERRIRARGLSCSLISLRKQWKNL